MIVGFSNLCAQNLNIRDDIHAHKDINESIALGNVTIFTVTILTITPNDHNTHRLTHSPTNRLSALTIQSTYC